MDPNAATDLIQALAAIALAARLLYLNLASRFPALLAYVAFVAIINLGLAALRQSSALYFLSYIVVEILKCVFSILAVRELFSLAFRDYPGIRTVGRWGINAGVALALGISLTVTGFFWSGAAAGRAHSYLFYLHVTQRSIVFTLAIAIVTILWFLSKYPLHLGRSILVSSSFFSLLFLSEAVRLLIDSLAPKLYNLRADWAQSVFISLCLVAWAVLLGPETQKKTSQVRVSYAHEEHLLQQLTSLNQLMARATRR